MLAEGIGTGPTVYTAGKLAKGQQAKELLEWAAAQQPNSRYYAMLVAELGPDFYQNVLKPVIDSRRYWVDGAAVTFLRNNLGIVDDYDAGRALVKAAGLGRLIQLDHLVEQRILRYWDELLEQLENAGNFSSAMVPANQFAAASFRKAGMTEFMYVHTVKTALMEKWVPGGNEAKFTVQELFDAYQLVFVHELHFSYDTFLFMVEGDFEFMWQLVRDHADE